MTRMLTIKDLLNPETPEETSFATQDVGFFSHSTSPMAGPSRAFATPSPQHWARARPSRSNSSNQLVPQERINFPPFQVQDDATLALMRPFGITSTEDIGQKNEHVPYLSEKQNLSVKMGRDSIEVFQYDFFYNCEVSCQGKSSTPNQLKKWTVMWDYNIGIVRLMPMFKSLGYQKTKPGQAISKNPGLKEISPSITGGTVKAQGYWLPYDCARALFSTFCHAIAPALIPLFGPSFPSECAHPSSPGFGNMRIDQAIIAGSTIQLQNFKDMYASQFDNSHPAERQSHQRSPRSAAPSPVNNASPATRQERTPRLVSAWSAINTPASSGGPPTPSSRPVTPAHYRRPLVDQRPGPMAVFEPKRLAAMQNVKPSPNHSLELAPIVGHRPVSDSYSMKRRRTHDEASNSYRVRSLGRLGLATVSENKAAGDEFHAARALLGMCQGKEDSVDHKSAGPFQR